MSSEMYPPPLVVPSLFVYIGLASAGVPHITQRWKRPETARDRQRWLQMGKGGRRQPEMARDGLRWPLVLLKAFCQQRGNKRAM